MKILEIFKKPVFIIVAIVIIVSTISSIYFFIKYQQAQTVLKDPTQAVEKEKRALIEKVGKLIELPTDEIPTIATVSDVEKLSDQTFFAKAKNGDKLLIYNNAKKAILYDPSADKIIEVAPINIGESQNQQPSETKEEEATESAGVSPTAQETKTLDVYLYNGTKAVGLTGKVEEQILGKSSNYKIIDKDNAQKRDYTTTLVIDLTGKRKDEAEELAKILKAEVSTLPAGETKPEGAQFLVIVGEDKK